MRTVFAILCTGVLLVFGLSTTPAAAGGYYSNGYYGNGYYGNGYYGNGYYGNGYYGGRSSVWYSSNCCYRKIVRHVRTVNFVPTEPYRYGYYGNGYRYGYYGRPYGVGYYGRPYRYGYYGGGYRYGDGYYGGNGYDAYNAAYSAKAKHCSTQRVRVPDGHGGRVWGVKKICG
jgi:hypothetical protein